MNCTKGGKIIQEFEKALGNFKEFWEIYNGFILMAIMLGIANFFSIFFWGGPAYYVSIGIFFSLNSIIALLGVLYIGGFCLFFIHFLKRIGIVHRNPEKSTTTHANSYLYLSLFMFLAFDILTYIYFIVLPFPFPQGEVHIFGGPTYFMPPSFSIGPGFISSVVLTAMIIMGINYDIIHDKRILRQLYETYLPKYAPKKQQQLEDLERNQK